MKKLEIMDWIILELYCTVIVESKGELFFFNSFEYFSFWRRDLFYTVYKKLFLVDCISLCSLKRDCKMDVDLENNFEYCSNTELWCRKIKIVKVRGKSAWNNIFRIHDQMWS